MFNYIDRLVDGKNGSCKVTLLELQDLYINRDNSS